MSYKLFIDDERNPIGEDWVIERSSAGAQWAIESYGIPHFISFDHDLGGEDTSMVFIKWLIDYMLDNNLKFPEDFDFYLHSQNPVGKTNIEYIMNNFISTIGKY